MRIDAITGKIYGDAADILEREGQIEGHFRTDQGYCAVSAIVQAKMNAGLERPAMSRVDWIKLEDLDSEGGTYSAREVLAFAEWIQDHRTEWIVEGILSEDDELSDTVWRANDNLVRHARGSEIIAALREAGSSAE